MKQYRELVQRVMREGVVVPDRTGTGTRKVFGHQMRFNLRDGFPLVTLKKTFFRGVVVELLWMLRGDTNVGWLQEHGVHIWDEWADEQGRLGPVYGAQWRDVFSPEGFSTDQMDELLNNLMARPFSRRHVVSSWNPSELPDEKKSPQQNVKDGLMALAPCHCLFQFDVAPDPEGGKPILSCQLYQRSADLFLGVPFNVASYALLTHMLAHYLGYQVGDFIWTGGDCHLYANHIEQVAQMLQREPLPLSRVSLDYPTNRMPWEVEPEEINLHDYQHHDAIKAPVAV